jgi:hypothetical protein
MTAPNMHLSLLRDGALFGTSWAGTRTTANSVVAELRADIAHYTAWAPHVRASRQP